MRFSESEIEELTSKYKKDFKSLQRIYRAQVNDKLLILKHLTGFYVKVFLEGNRVYMSVIFCEKTLLWLVEQ